MTFHFLIRCEGGSIQISEIAYGMYNYEWNSHLMGRFWLNISAIFCIAFALFLSFSLFVGSCHIACFSHIITACSTIISSLTFFRLAVFHSAEVHRLMSKGQEAVLTQKAAEENHHVATVDMIFATVGIFPPAGDIEHCGLGFFSTAFLGCRDP